MTWLDDAKRRKLITFYQEQPILCDTSLKLTTKVEKGQKEAALKELEECFDFKYMSSDLVGVWKRSKKSEQGRWQTWRAVQITVQFFFTQLQLLRPSIDRSCHKQEWSENERCTLINIYNTNTCLWNHQTLSNRTRCQVLLQQLGEQLHRKYTEKEIVNTWNNLKTYFKRQRMRQEASKSSGTGTSKVKQNFIFFSC